MVLGVHNQLVSSVILLNKITCVTDQVLCPACTPNCAQPRRFPFIITCLLG